MKAITLWQPYASLVALGVKTIETRSWSTSYRGPLAIHAAKGERWREGARFGDWLAYRTSQTHPARIYRSRDVAVIGLPLGQVVATCMLVDVIPVVRDGWPACDEWRPALVVEDDTLSVYRTRDPEQFTNVDAQAPYGDFTPGRYAWILESAAHLSEPIPARGRQGLWEWRS